MRISARGMMNNFIVYKIFYSIYGRRGVLFIMKSLNLKIDLFFWIGGMRILDTIKCF